MLTRGIFIAYFLFAMLIQSNAKEVSYKFLQRRVGYRILPSEVTRVYENVGDVMACMALCSQRHSCLAASYKVEGEVCNLCRYPPSFSVFQEYVTPGTGWVLMSKAFFPVFLAMSPLGAYKLTFDEGKLLCKEKGSEIATRADLIEAFNLKLVLCRCGWLADETSGVIVNEKTVMNCPMANLAGQIETCSSNKSDVWCQMK